ncbi:FKBP-type peptidyl-prolyl cis-trans isomerase FkpA [Flavobacterium sp. PL11]|uniref:FKBP-type peptidyl-prolyl cis-trans isomerase n=1 Tax=Flavobacterium sp. PL11 TaxID=3071717 RepID=UPI002DFD58DD|nr:FKBP-type peptidyl-prolyl cis-trans isomerase FkpA [Flavobacterium sp. PL11]
MKYFLVALLSLILVSCLNDKKKDNDNQVIDYKAQNEKEITDYIAKNKLNATKSKSGLYYVINDKGTGAYPNISSNIRVAYKGYYTNGEVFDESTSNGIPFNLNQVIRGWIEGLTYFKEGGSGILLVPAHLAYGSSTYNGIPPGSVLIFDFTLIAVN